MKLHTLSLALAALFITCTLRAQVPQLINYQGRVAANAVNFEGAGLFKFALVNSDGTTTFWSNDGTSAAGSEPVDAVSLPVSKGLYSVLLGDVALASMTAIPASVFTNPDVRLRVWFNDGVNGSQLLDPDQRLAPAAYLADGAVTAATIADESIIAAKIAPGTIDGTRIAPASLDFGHLFVPAAPGAGQILSFDGASLNWVTAGDSDGIWAVNGAHAFYNVGNVGIGTSTPSTYGHGGTARFLEVNNNGTAANSQAHLILSTGVSSLAESWIGTVTWAQPGGIAAFIGGYARSTTPNAPAGMLVLGTRKIGEAAPSPKMVIHEEGNVGIGTVSPVARLHLYEPASSVTHLIETAGGTNNSAQVRFRNGNGEWVVGTSRDFNGDQLYFSREGGAAPGFALQPNGDGWLAGTMSCRVLTIRGGADLAEPFAMSERGVTPGAVVVIDPANPGKLKRSAAPYDKKVAGIVSGANGIHPGISMIDEAQLEAGENVALSGRVYVKANTLGGTIEPGDLLTTSEVPGEAMKAADHQRAQGAILGKAMTRLDETTGTVLVLVTLQ